MYWHLGYLFISMFSVVAMSVSALQHYGYANESVAKNLKYQCGHGVFFRASQLNGFPITNHHLSKLPIRKSGVSLGELQGAFETIGYQANVRHSSQVNALTTLSICKLNNPGHFLLVKRDGRKGQEASFLIYDNLERPQSISGSELQDRFSGYWISLVRRKNSMENYGIDNGPVPSFDRLLVLKQAWSELRS